MGGVLIEWSPNPTGQDHLCVCTKPGMEELESQIPSWGLSAERPAPSLAWGLLCEGTSLETSSMQASSRSLQWLSVPSLPI